MQYVPKTVCSVPFALLSRSQTDRFHNRTLDKEIG